MPVTASDWSRWRDVEQWVRACVSTKIKRVTLFGFSKHNPTFLGNTKTPPAALSSDNKKNHDGQCPSRRVTGRGDGTWIYENMKLWNSQSLIVVSSVYNFFTPYATLIYLIFFQATSWCRTRSISLILAQKRLSNLTAFFKDFLV